MGKRSTTTGYWRAHGDSKRVATAAVMPVVLGITGIDATLATTGILTGKFMPVGAIPLRVDVVGNGTGGTGPLLDVGLNLATPDNDGLLVGADPEANSSSGLGATEAGVLMGVALTETAEVTVSDGGGVNSTGGTFDLFIYYTFVDDGVAND